MNCEIIVVGGGHAGAEASIAAAKCGCSVLLITGNTDFIGEMPCNPAIGGVAKGNIVREIDALGGIMAKAADRAGIQFRMLNKSKGAAVWGPRCQTDRFLYRQIIREEIEKFKNIMILQDMVSDIVTDEKSVRGVITERGLKINSKAVIITAGTFLNGLAHIGSNQIICGRNGELASTKLSENIQKLGINAGRLKTGTSARIDKNSIDFSVLQIQKGDENPQPFSFSTDFSLNNSAVCGVVKTNAQTHKIIMDNIDKSPLYGLKTIVGVGPRYCPSIEDKLMRFGEREGHSLFVEPEGLGRREMYLNGFSTSLPADVQIKMVQSLKGFENAKIIKPAYAIEYDYFEPIQLSLSLESKIVPNLYFAGQINGTSGYEEAGGQGLIAGLNAALKILTKEPFILRRDEAYIGVLIDDLVSKGTQEPYRMFTARAEYRLLLRQDNADERLMSKAFELKLVSRETFERRENVWKKKEKLKREIHDTVVCADIWNKSYEPIKENTHADNLLKRPNVNIKNIASSSDLDISQYDDEVCLSAEFDIFYEGFIVRQKEMVEKTIRYEDAKIPNSLDYNKIIGLSAESKEKLKRIKPQTIGQILRISGVSPADASVVLVYLSQENEKVFRETSIDEKAEGDLRQKHENY
ncbi:MAG: tRNA uridine-5-carboxymethylaminomethyl(34) synthesis enzyme MnmG [Chitinispirillales bacterium]|jgi:tRNA uridine 5-carboxymethylaminomethyl modification enzyme|nr:tRNA uridine-5-carboxymethylaminomethyl(34) synthesis enzyme MnmG [Chitinispirillales bacterium]